MAPGDSGPESDHDVIQVGTFRAVLAGSVQTDIFSGAGWVGDY